MADQRMEWIGCDSCPYWFHYACLGTENQINQIQVDLSTVTALLEFVANVLKSSFDWWLFEIEY